MVAVVGLDIISNTPSLADGRQASTTERLRTVVENAVLFEELGFDGFAVGERHHPPFVSSSPPVVLSHIAARTRRIRLLTGVTLLSVLDPVRVAEDYATLDHLSDGRLELIVGKGNGPEQAELFGIRREQAWATQRENYRLLRQIWSGGPVSWEPREDAPSIRRTALHDVEIQPRPLQERIRTWHGSSTSVETVELAAEHGDPIWVANFQKSVEGYAPLVDRYRQAWAEQGRDPADALVGSGFSLYLAPTSQQALDTFRPIHRARFADRVDTFNDFADDTLFHGFDDYVERSAALIGSPAQALDKLGRYVEAYGFSAITIPGHRGDLEESAWRDGLELFRTEVWPELSRIAPRPASWPGPVPRPA